MAQQLLPLLPRTQARLPEPHGRSPPSAVLVPRNRILSFDLYGQRVHTMCIHEGKILTRTKRTIFLKQRKVDFVVELLILHFSSEGV